MDLRQVLREFQLDALIGRIFIAIDSRFFFPGYGCIHIQNLYFCRQTFMRASAVVDHFYLVRCRIPLDMQRLGSLLDSKIGGSRLEIIIIRLPYH